MSKTYYDILGVKKSASKDEIVKAKRDLSKKYHPDKLPESQREHGTKMCQQINEAYEVLSDDSKRQIYDTYGKEGLNGQSSSNNPFPPGFPFTNGNPFGNASPFGNGPFAHMNSNPFVGVNPQQWQSQIKPIELLINITLEELFSGKNIAETVKRINPCDSCESTGSSDKKIYKCATCKGNGQYYQQQMMGPIGMQQVLSKCSKCFGTGKCSPKKCGNCKGATVTKDDFIINYKLDKGMDDNRCAVLKGEGHYGSKNGQSGRGDIAITLNIMTHSVFKILRTYHLQMTIELQLVEALCGTVKPFKFLDGKDYYIDISDPINNDDIKILPDMGLPYKNSTYKCGDLYVKFKVIMPNVMSNALLEKLYPALTGLEYNYNTIHNVPDDVQPIELHDVSEYNEYNEDEQGRHPQEGNVQCTQQ
jgi:DnaJ-class molecular chaperone